MTLSYDLLVIDLDGTLLTPDGVVSDANAEAVAAARAAGLVVMIATGRALVESHTALDAIEHAGLAVTAGGAMLCDATDHSTLRRHAMPQDLVAQVAGALVDDGHKCLLLKDAHTTGYDYLAVGPADLDPASEWWFETLPVRVRFAHEIADDPHPSETVRVGAVAGAADLAPLARHIREEVGDRAFLQHWAAVTATCVRGTETHLLEVFNPEVNKWTMISEHCAQHGIETGRVAAIGDGLNDVELVRGAGLGVAMANADARVTAVADRVTDHHASDGVATAIGRILSGIW